MKQTLLIEPHYWPSIYFWSCIHRSSHIILEEHQFYVKRSYVNKCRILAANGPLMLIVPLKKGKHKHLAIKDVQISYDEDWRSKHLKSLQSSYGSSPFFEHYIDSISGIYEQAWNHISELNDAIIKWVINEFLSSSVPSIKSSMEYTVDIGENHTDLRDSLTPRTSNTSNSKEYNQVYEYKFRFVPNLSCLDLIFNVGPAFANYI